MAWLSEITTANTIVQRTRKWVQTQTIVLSRSRDADQSLTHYVGLTKAAADSYVSGHWDDTGVVEMYVERMNDAGAYRVVAEVITYGEWSEWA
jgi:hypothetical protein